MTPNSELRTPNYLRISLDEIFSELVLAGTQGQSSLQRKVLFEGERVAGISSYLAGWMARGGIDVIVLDGANGFDPYRVSSFARKILIPPERLLKKIRIARAFTCYQMATLVERLALLLHQEGAVQPESLPSSFRRYLRQPCVILLGPITTFLDEDVPEREVGPLFERSLRKMEIIAGKGIPFFLFQSHPFSKNPPFPPFAKNSPFPPLARGGKGGLKGSKRTYLMKRLFQFSNLVWKISREDEGPTLILEKGPGDCVVSPFMVRQAHHERA
ncbi:MAG TPA: hypothetical protein VLK23_01080 [Thermodesulfobacteriota bacterium]|nr:hypothetical protein [Thermodesulfobacteriota bacterium]